MKPNIACLAGLAAITLTASGGMAQAADANSVPALHAGLAAPSAAARPQAATLLYNQNNNGSGLGAESMNWGAGNAFNDQGADDFTVPKGKTWTITKVKVTEDPYGWDPTSLTVSFYKNTVNTQQQNLPGTLVKKQSRKGKTNDTTHAVVIPGITGVTLSAGHYWLSVQSNTPTGKEWYWNTRTVQHGSPAVWQNPGNGRPTSCMSTTWTVLSAGCSWPNGSSVGPDFMFALYGTG